MGNHFSFHSFQIRIHLNNCSRKKMQMNIKYLHSFKFSSNMCQNTHIIVDIISVYRLSCVLIFSFNIVCVCSSMNWQVMAPPSNSTCFPVAPQTPHVVLRHSNRCILLPYCYFNLNLYWLVKSMLFYVMIYCVFFLM